MFVQTSKIQIVRVALTMVLYAGLFVVHRAGTQDVFANYFYFATSAIVRIAMAVFVYAKHVHQRGFQRGSATSACFSA